MAFELYYTSTPKGLRPGASGFCTAGATVGIPSPLIERLESLSSYQSSPIVAGATPSGSHVAFTHLRVSTGGPARSVLSRIAPAGFDYTGRSNKLAYHLVLETAELSDAGPAWLISQPDVMAHDWQGPARLLPAEKHIPRQSMEPRRCAAWESATGDAGWAGVLAEAFLNDPSRVAYIICHHGSDLLPLLNEAILLVPPALRWQVTFSTYFIDLPAGLNCAWRCAIADTPSARIATRRASSGVIIDLTASPKRAPDTAGAECARRGVLLNERLEPASAARGRSDGDA